MTRNRTGFDLYSRLSNEAAVLLLALALAVSNYFAVMRERLRHSEVRGRRRAARQPAA